MTMKRNRMFICLMMTLIPLFRILFNYNIGIGATYGDVSDNHGGHNNSTIIDVPSFTDYQTNNQKEMQKCEQYVKRTLEKANSDPGSINQLRRRLAQNDPTCYKQTFSILAKNFQDRLQTVKAHFNLHIPKAGGSSLCDMAKSVKVTPTTNNCFGREHFYPVWVSGDMHRRKVLMDGQNTTCDVYTESNEMPEFVMNENYLDHPLCLTHRIYSVTLRNPIDRAMSQERHFYALRSNGHGNNVTSNHILSLVRHDYITWALSTGVNEENRFSLIRQKEHLEVAKDTLSRFDFLIDLSLNDTCRNATWNLMGLGNSTIGHARPRAGQRFDEYLKPREYYEKWNSLDSKLYNYAKTLMDLDCEFFLKLNL